MGKFEEAKIARNEKIYELRMQGVKLRVLAKRFRITIGRVHAILAAQKAKQTKQSAAAA